MATGFLPIPTNRRPLPAATPARALPRSSHWLFVMIGVQMVCQLGLLFETLAPFRVIFRSGAFGINLVALALAFGPRRQPHHPAFWFGVACLLWIAIQILHPNTNTAISAVATLGLAAAVIAPLFWVPRLEINLNVVRTVILVFWGFHSLSTFFGILQVYFPGNFQPALSQAVKEQQWAGEHLKVSIASGDTIYRPMGLTDIPGGAANAGLYTFVFGLGLYSLSRGGFGLIAGLISLPCGLFCIYLSEVRVMLVLCIIISIVFAALLVVTKRFGSAARTSFIVPVVVAGAFAWAMALGGDSTVSRFETLIEENPDKIYYKNRGHFLEETFDYYLPEFPLGAGLGRWGMINTYFGDRTLEESSMLWAEIQWTSWIFDGGIPLLIAYPLAVLIATVATARIAFKQEYGELAGWAMLILAYDSAMLAFTFSYAPFVGQAGIEFWMLNAMIWTCGQQMKRRAKWYVG